MAGHRSCQDERHFRRDASGVPTSEPVPRSLPSYPFPVQSESHFARSKRDSAVELAAKIALRKLGDLWRAAGKNLQNRQILPEGITPAE